MPRKALVFPRPRRPNRLRGYDASEQEFLQYLRRTHNYRASRHEPTLTGNPAFSLISSLMAPSVSFKPKIDVIPLTTTDDWKQFNIGVTWGTTTSASKGPWRRIINILRGLEAKTCVVENDYICLDYRSELSSFYAQLNAEYSRRSPRLHFFSQQVRLKDVFKLGKDQKDAYLGYVVLRPGDLPMVGRTMIRTPSNIEVAASVEEPVNFFGQHLYVEGVPFMQQDERFDVCAHVAAWAAHYSAYRRGLVERRLIANFVATPQGLHPMSPVAANGLSESDIIDLFSRAGLRSIYWLEPGDDPDPRFAALEQDVQEECCKIAKTNPLSFPKDRPFRFSELITRFDNKMNPPTDDETWYDNEQALQALRDQLIYSLARLYLSSRWPIYCSTANHAMLLCGTSMNRAGKPVFFFHDDQYGPYLALPTTSEGANTAAFKYQAWITDADDTSHTCPGSTDRTKEVCDDDAGKWKSDGLGNRLVHAMIIPLPSRFLLDPFEAAAEAFKTIDKLKIPRHKTRVSILMGTNYRQLRRNDVLKNLEGMPDALSLYSSMDLAEWVVLVEGFTYNPDRNQDVVEWEFVFDGSSGAAAPVVQFARLKDSGMYSPGINTPIQTFNLPGLIIEKFPRVPSKIGKAQESDEVR